MAVDLFIRITDGRLIIDFYCKSYTFDSFSERYYLNGIENAAGDLDHFGFKEGRDTFAIWMRGLETITVTTKEIIDEWSDKTPISGDV